jgi:general secretion pathway protein D
VRPDELRNMLILSGTERELKHLMETIEMFDIDWMAGMSAGVFTLQNSDVKSVMAELEKLVGDRNTSPITGILKIVPIERMNALLVVTPNPAYLEEVKKWIERLDKGGEGGGLQLYVYKPAEHPRGAYRAPAPAGVHRPGAGAGRSPGAHGRAGHAGGHDRQSAGVPGASHAAPGAAVDGRRKSAAGCARRRAGRRHRP